MFTATQPCIKCNSQDNHILPRFQLKTTLRISLLSAHFFVQNLPLFQLKTTLRMRLLSAHFFAPWNTNTGLDDPIHMRSSTWNYVSARRRAFNSSAASFFVWLVNRWACGHPSSFQFCKGASSSRVRVTLTRR